MKLFLDIASNIYQRHYIAINNTVNIITDTNETNSTRKSTPYTVK